MEFPLCDAIFYVCQFITRFTAYLSIDLQNYKCFKRIIRKTTSAGSLCVLSMNSSFVIVACHIFGAFKCQVVISQTLWDQVLKTSCNISSAWKNPLKCIAFIRKATVSLEMLAQEIDQIAPSTISICDYIYIAINPFRFLANFRVSSVSDHKKNKFE